jgi:hypothetical protein
MLFNGEKRDFRNHGNPETNLFFSSSITTYNGRFSFNNLSAVEIFFRILLENPENWQKGRMSGAPSLLKVLVCPSRGNYKRSRS